MNVQPIERNTVTYFLYFDKEDLTIQIDKPEGIEKSDFELKQNSNGYGRYITFADEVEIIFTPRKDHQFKKLCELYRIRKWQNSAYLIIKVNDVELINARLKFSETETDYTYFFKVKIDINNQREIIEAKKSTTLDLKSNKSIDDKDITSIELMDLKTKYKEIYSDNSIYLDKPSFPYIETITESQSYYDNIWLNIFTGSKNKSDMVKIGTGFLNFNPPDYTLSNEDLYTSFKNEDQNTKILVKIQNVEIDFSLDRTPIVSFRRRIVNYDSSGGFINETWVNLIVTETNKFKYEFEETIELLPYQELFYYMGFGRIIQNNPINGTINFKEKPLINFFSVTLFEDTITKSCRLIDIGKQCLKSITNDAVTVNAPRFTNVGGNFYDLYGTSGLFLRQYNDQPFYATWKGFLDYIQNSFNCDAQINGTEVFIGHETDFYKNFESGRIEFSPNDDSYKTLPNKRFVKSGFSLEYDKYEDDESSSNTIDSIHVASEYNLVDSQPLDDPSDEKKINYVADQYMIENIRRESFDKDSTKTVPNDKEIYVIDTITEGGILQNRSDQGFDVENLYSPETSYNLRLSVKRLVIDYFGEFLRHTSQYISAHVPWKNVKYLNNRIAQTTCIDPSIPTTNLTVIEGESISPSQLPLPILTGDVYEFDLAYRMKFNKFWELYQSILNDMGYVTFFNESGTEIKIYITEMKYSWENEKLYNIKGERKYE